jgi:RNA polymerase sigma-70 factor (ECF subfamily)
MLGTGADAEDIVQEAYIRWHEADPDEIRSAEAWLVSVVTRLSIDRLRKASVEREKYIGPWLPEPLLTDYKTPEVELEKASDLSMAFMVLLERLAPVERAAFLLHDVFDCAYPAIANILRKSEAACRQVVHRARERVRSEQPRYKATEEQRRSLITKFVAAASAGDEEGLLLLFKEDARLMSDGGGVVNAARKIVTGRRRIARLFALLKRKLGERFQQKVVSINSEPGVLTFIDGQLFSTTSIETDGTSITTMYTVINPAKLTRIKAH